MTAAAVVADSNSTAAAASMSQAHSHKQLRWQSRRGLLELDLLLDNFWQTQPSLADSEWALLSEWLALDDNDLWALLASADSNSSVAAANTAAASLAHKINACTTAARQ